MPISLGESVKAFSHKLVMIALVMALPLLNLSSAVCLGQQESPVIPQGGVSLLAQDPLEEVYWYPTDNSGLAKTDIVEAQGMPFRKAIRTTTFKQPTTPWDVGVGTYLSGTVNGGDVCLLSFYARSSGSDETSRGAIHAYLEFVALPHDKIVAMPVTADKEWRRIYMPFRAESSLQKGNVRIVFHLGFAPQTVEIGGISLLDFGPKASLSDLPVTKLTYKGREPDAPWRKQAAERIERARKDRLVAQVVDSSDRPVEGADVHVKMLGHAFGFGSAVTAKLLGVDRNDAKTIREHFEEYGGLKNVLTYRKTVESLFNKATFENDLKLLPWLRARSNRDSEYRREWTDRALDWLNKRNIAVRGHWIACGRTEELPTEMLAGPRYQLRDYIFANIQERLKAVGSRGAEWDAINHIVWPDGNLETLFGSPDINVEVIKESGKLAPHTPLWVNEGMILAGGSLRDAYEKSVRYLIDHDAAPAGVGFMGHFDRFSLTPPDEQLQVFERFAKLSPNLQVTELDVDVGDDEQLQADYLRDAMTVAFSEEACKGVVIWGFWEGRIDKPNACLFRKDWSEKPAAKAWKDLVLGDWRTEVQGATDVNGVYEQRCFLGKYAITAEWKGRKGTANASLDKGGATIKIRLR
jgi:endo-1,4-beta-xylanase